jgi:hypothetical protein
VRSVCRSSRGAGEANHRPASSVQSSTGGLQSADLTRRRGSGPAPTCGLRAGRARRRIVQHRRSAGITRCTGHVTPDGAADCGERQEPAATDVRRQVPASRSDGERRVDRSCRRQRRGSGDVSQLITTVVLASRISANRPAGPASSSDDDQALRWWRHALRERQSTHDQAATQRSRIRRGAVGRQPGRHRNAAIMPALVLPRRRPARRRRSLRGPDRKAARPATRERGAGLRRLPHHHGTATPPIPATTALASATAQSGEPSPDGSRTSGRAAWHRPPRSDAPHPRRATCRTAVDRRRPRQSTPARTCRPGSHRGCASSQPWSRR